MTTAKKIKSVKGYNAVQELKAVDKLFADMSKDKSLPSFGEHVLYCIVLGTSENVNLKKMYPKLHRKLKTWVTGHNDKILSLRK